MISLDTTLAAHPDGDARQRHRAYATRIGCLSIVVHTPADTSSVSLSTDGLSIYPTSSRHKLTFVFDAIREATHVARTQPIDLIVTQDPFATGLVGAWLRWRFGIPLLVQNHSYIFGNDAWLAEKPFRNRLLNTLGKWVVRQADMVRTVNRKEHDNYLAMGGSDSRVVALPLGTASRNFAQPVDTEALDDLRTRLGLLPTHKIVLWVGYPVGFKRIPMLFKVFRRVVEAVPEAHLVLIGDISRSPHDLPALAYVEGIDTHLVMHGPVSHDQLPLYYALGDVYVHTSAYEGVPRVLFEASAAGLPLVAMSAVGVDEVIEDGINGYLVPSDDIEVMAERVVSLLHDPTLARVLGAAARDRAFEHYDAERYADSWVGVWEKAIALGRK